MTDPGTLQSLISPIKVNISHMIYNNIRIPNEIGNLKLIGISSLPSGEQEGKELIAYRLNSFWNAHMTYKVILFLYLLFIFFIILKKIQKNNLEKLKVIEKDQKKEDLDYQNKEVKKEEISFYEKYLADFQVNIWYNVMCFFSIFNLLAMFSSIGNLHNISYITSMKDNKAIFRGASSKSIFLSSLTLTQFLLSFMTLVLILMILGFVLKQSYINDKKDKNLKIYFIFYAVLAIFSISSCLIFFFLCGTASMFFIYSFSFTLLTILGIPIINEIF